MVDFNSKSLQLLAVGALLGIAGAVSANEASSAGAVAVVSTGMSSVEIAARTMRYWTAEKMRNATPMPLARGIVSSAEIEAARDAQPRVMPGDPMVIPGWNPASGRPQPEPGARIEVELGSTRTAAQPTYTVPPGSPPANPIDYANYGPFQRWTHFGRYLTYPRSVIGKLFFTQNGTNYVCSATVVGVATVMTAGHCVSDGNGNFSTDLLFCPSYNKNGVNPNVGCWAWTGYVSTPGAWHNGGNFDRDYACFVTASTGTVVSNHIGNVTGWAGLATNWPSRYLEMAFGYPAASPFPGYHIIQVAGVDWYEFNMDPSDSNRSKYMGNDMTGGASGGPWFLNWEHGNSTAVYPAPSPDNSGDTDPFAGNTGPYLNGVNSHKRCLISCGTPTATSGTFFDEMGSPQFTSSANDSADVLDVYNLCLANGGGGT